MSKLVARFARHESGATAMEYGLIAALISVALIASFSALQPGFDAAFALIAGNIPAVK